MYFDDAPRLKSKIKYEEGIKEKLWRVYGKLIWQPTQKLIRRSMNISGFRSRKWYTTFFPEYVENEYMYHDFTFRGKFYRYPSIHHVVIGNFFRALRTAYIDKAYTINNPKYKKDRPWYLPVLYVGKMVDYIYRSDYICCGVDAYMDDDESRYECVNHGVEGTMDGTNYWSVGFVHCHRCNTPIEFREDSL